MSSTVKFESKRLLTGDTFRLFFISMLSFVLRRGVFVLWLYCLVGFIKSGILKFYLESYNDAFVYTVVLIDLVFISSIVFLFICALRLGEQFLYFIKASGGKGRLPLLFHFFTFSRSFRAFCLYMRLTVLKALWLLYYLFPCGVCFGITFYLYSNGNLLPSVFYVLVVGSSVLLSFCVFMWRVTFSRYNAAVYYVCLNSEISPKAAINKSVYFTDGFLRESVLFEGSFFGWFLSCLAVVPFIYVLPYFKIAKALYVVESISLKAYPEINTKYAINYLRLK